MSVVAPPRRARTTVAVPQPTIGGLADYMFELRELKKAKEAEVAEIEARFKEAEEKVMALLDEQQSTKGAGSLASVSITTSVTASEVDWPKVEQYIKKTGFFHLFQRRIADAAYRELLEQGKKVPGITPFNKRRLNLTRKS